LLTQQIDELLQLTSEILDQESGFLLLNLYSMGFSPLISETLVRVHFPFVKDLEMGELFVEDQFNKKLPLGTFCRASW
jgi:23S rRNA (cytosine1962-C5)-methyltransferase